MARSARCRHGSSRSADRVDIGACLSRATVCCVLGSSSNGAPYLTLSQRRARFSCRGACAQRSGCRGLNEASLGRGTCRRLPSLHRTCLCRTLSGLGCDSAPSDVFSLWAKVLPPSPSRGCAFGDPGVWTCPFCWISASDGPYLGPLVQRSSTCGGPAKGRTLRGRRFGGRGPHVLPVPNLEPSKLWPWALALKAIQ
jgi:hypothetical protein